jgi:hypothetical protein
LRNWVHCHIALKIGWLPPPPSSGVGEAPHGCVLFRPLDQAKLSRLTCSLSVGCRASTCYKRTGAPFLWVQNGIYKGILGADARAVSSLGLYVVTRYQFTSTLHVSTRQPPVELFFLSLSLSLSHSTSYCWCHCHSWEKRARRVTDRGSVLTRRGTPPSPLPPFAPVAELA